MALRDLIRAGFSARQGRAVLAAAGGGAVDEGSYLVSLAGTAVTYGPAVCSIPRTAIADSDYRLSIMLPPQYMEATGRIDVTVTHLFAEDLLVAEAEMSVVDLTGDQSLSIQWLPEVPIAVPSGSTNLGDLSAPDFVNDSATALSWIGTPTFQANVVTDGVYWALLTMRVTSA